MNGVNLGNWLVVERWMDESLFADIEGSDEYSLSSDDRGRKRLLRHRETYITEADFKWMSEQGVEIVRLPIGYWLFGDEKPYVASVDKVDWTMDMADKYSLKVLIDLHGAPGSQNGYEHSGRAGTASWYDRPAYRRETETILLRIAHRYGSRESLWGIELLNEPVADTARQYFILLNFYRRVYRRLRKVLRPGVFTVFSDAYKPLLFTAALIGTAKHPVAMDVHWYSFATKADNYTAYEKKVLRRRRLLKYMQIFHPVVIGEWSGVLPDDYLSQGGRQETHIDMQRNIYGSAAAHMYWNYTSSKKSVWNYNYLASRVSTSGTQK